MFETYSINTPLLIAEGAKGVDLNASIVVQTGMVERQRGEAGIGSGVPARTNETGETHRLMGAKSMIYAFIAQLQRT